MNARVLTLGASAFGARSPDRPVARRLGPLGHVLRLARFGLLAAVLAIPVVVRPTVDGATALVSASEHDRCGAALRAVQDRGLVLPRQFEYRCPGDTQAFPGDRQHWGVTCYRQMFCPNGAYVAVNPSTVGPSDARLRYTVAHEIAHARDYVTKGITSEKSADAQAHAAGF